MRKLTHTGFSVIEVIIVVAVIGVLAAAGFMVMNKNKGHHMSAAEIAADEAKRTGGKDSSDPFADVDKKAVFITADPVDFAQVANLSKYRSCAGHDYSGVSIDNQTEKLRSMKHYINARSSMTAKTDLLKLYAPFDGTVTELTDVKDFGRGLTLTPTATQGWLLQYGHIDPVAGVAQGSKVKAGQLVGYAAIGPHGRGSEIAVWNTGKKGSGSMYGLDSMMNHMSPTVLASFGRHGVTPANLILTKEYRDGKACEVTGEVSDGDAIFKGNNEADDIVIVN